MNVRTILVLAAAATVGGGCAQPEAPRDHFYRLDLQPPPRAARPVFAHPVEVEAPMVDGLLTGRPIVFAEGGDPPVFQEYTYHLWMTPPATLIRDGLVRCLEQAGVADQVVTEMTRVDAPHSVIGHVDRFELISDPPRRAVVDIRLGLRDNARNRLTLWKSYDSEIVAENDDMKSGVRAVGAAFSEVCRRLTTDLAKP
jgi:ABC-type uncharacterized transport system auxiliary subunit